MLKATKDLQKYKVMAVDGEVGTVQDFYFDDKSWAVRYLVVDTGSQLPGRRVVVSPDKFGPLDAERSLFSLTLNQEQVENGLSVETAPPASRQPAPENRADPEIPLDRLGGGLFDERTFGMQPEAIVETIRAAENAEPAPSGPTHEEDLNLRSSGEVNGYSVQAKDGHIGHVEDIMVDDNDWTVQYLLVDTRDWLPGKKVLVSTDWIDRISWNERHVTVALTQEAVRNSPEE